ncbi:hypothetical protein AcW1_007451 [Taiwanofungus camphoratus]|nr:hypothetical protein AcW2_007491 [Antrodia cinnamomea]KAI0927242.1 hypothetical protein AcV5_007829 [Antrodia cinnamomea]KAI0947153.1 hypothetical protein AcV7_009652 [Antrodia cinnamomea]KAI0953158.1 hypothetical protein AcW1_007451 [Antrodia cinnamomea]
MIHTIGPLKAAHGRPSTCNARTLLPPRISCRFASTKIKQPAQSWAAENTPIDPRPRWVFPLSRVANYVVIPSTLLYAVFFADFGEKEHVFMPARRWLDAQKAAFFSLSAAERKMAGVVDQSDLTEVQSDR